MKVNPYSTIRPSSTTRKRDASGVSSADFEGYLEEAAGASEASSTTATQDTGTVSSLDALLALQGVSDDAPGRQQAMTRGADLLDLLDDIRHALLMGTLSEGTLRQITSTLRERQQGYNDPALQEIVADIELRAAVELAKLEMAARQ